MTETEKNQILKSLEIVETELGKIDEIMNPVIEVKSIPTTPESDYHSENRAPRIDEIRKNFGGQ